MRKRAWIVGVAIVGLVGLMAPVALGSPVAENKSQWQTYGRVFLDPAESYNYIQFGDKGQGEFYKGFSLLQKLYPRYLELTTVAKELHNPNAVSVGADGFPAWDPRDTGDGLPLYVVIVTDHNVPDKNKHYMVMTAGHSAEPCGREGAARFLENLLISATTTPDKTFTNGSGTSGKTFSMTAGQILAKTKLYFILPSPDGWYKGDGMPSGGFSQYNGAGINSNRLAYSDGWVFPPNHTLYLRGYTTFSQPEGIGMTEYLDHVRKTELHGKPFAIGMDMHGPYPAGFILLHDEGLTPFKLNRMLDLGLRVKQEMEENTPLFGPAQNANDDAGAGYSTVADNALDAGVAAIRDNAPDNRNMGTTDNDAWRTQALGRWGFVTHIVDSLGYTVIGSWGGYFGSNSGLGATSLSYEINCRAQGPWLNADEQNWINNTGKALEAGVVTAAAWDQIPSDKVHMKKKVGFYEPGTRVTDKDGNPSPPPHGYPGNPLAHQLHQTHYNVENTDYFRGLKDIVDKPPVPVAPSKVPSALGKLDSFVVDDSTVSDTADLKKFVEGGGDLVLTDSALQMVPKIASKISDKDVKKGYAYVGYSDLDRSNPLTKGLLATAWQTYAPSPIGYPLLMSRDSYWGSGTNSQDASNRSPTTNSAPIWTVDRDAWESAGGTTIGTADPPKERRALSDGENQALSFRQADQDKTEIGVLPVGKGRIVIFGALLPQPTEKFPHWFGLDSNAISEAGQTMLLRVLSGQF
ncbi:MAG: hypothetical protein M3290_01505 [Actinomycetota bacterium]|nr:hypothetical protein [Actinomycetota bacterium]